VTVVDVVMNSLRPIRRRLGRSIALGVAVVGLSAMGGTPPGHATVAARRRAAHDLHLTHSRVVVDGRSVLVRVRLFNDDLEQALRSDPRNASMTVAATPAVDSAFAAYFNEHVSITTDGTRLRGKVLQSGPDGDGKDQAMWWYLVELIAPKPVKSLGMRNALLFELFRDQRNMVTLLKMPGERRFALYFVPDEKKMQVVDF